MKIEHEGEEIEVFTADDLAAAKVEVENQYKPMLEEVTTKLTASEKRAAERAGEFKQFRELNEKQVNELSEKDRIIYENTKALKEAQDVIHAERTKSLESQIDSSIRAKAGTNEKLATRMKEMWSVIGIEATTPEQIASKTAMVLGALSTTEPDLVASIGNISGSALPPGTNTIGEKNFSETDQGKNLANELGLKL